MVERYKGRLLPIAGQVESLGQLSGKLAHDFGNVLEVIHSNLEVVLLDSDLKLSDEHRACLRDALKACSIGATLSHHLLGYVRKQSLEVSSLSLRSMVLDVVNLCSHCLDQSFEIVVDETLAERDIHVFGSYSTLGHSLLTLLQRAAGSMPDGGRISITLLEEKGYIHLYVNDQGRAIDPDSLREESVSEPFEGTVEDEIRTLAIIRSLLEQQEGNLTVRPCETGGTSVILSLPMDEGRSPLGSSSGGGKRAWQKMKVDEEDVPEEGRLVRKTQLIDFRKYMVLMSTQREVPANTVWVIDDDPLVRRGVCRSMHVLGLNVLQQFSSPIDVLALFRSGQSIQWPNWIFVDYAMPELNGLALIRSIMNQLKVDGHSKELEIALMSAYPPEDLSAELSPQEREKVHLLTKPFGLETVRELVLRRSESTTRSGSDETTAVFKQRNANNSSCFFGKFETNVGTKTYRLQTIQQKNGLSPRHRDTEINANKRGIINKYPI